MRDKKSPIIVAIALAVVIICMAFLLRTNDGKDSTASDSSTVSEVAAKSGDMSSGQNGNGKNGNSEVKVVRNTDAGEEDGSQADTGEVEGNSQEVAQVERDESGMHNRVPVRQVEDKDQSSTKNSQVTQIDIYTDSSSDGKKSSDDEKNNSSESDSSDKTTPTPTPKATATPTPKATATPTPTKDPDIGSEPIVSADPGDILEKIQNAVVGDVISLGAIDQDGVTNNGDEVIDWIVLDKNDSASLIVSEYALEGKCYNDTRTAITWEDSTLRSWLKGEFYDKCFDDAEKEFILNATIPADPNPDYDTDCGNSTTDKVFLLSYMEAYSYFDDDEARRCQATEHAVNDGVLYNGEYGGTTWWWLRTAGAQAEETAIVNSDGSVTSNGLVIGGGAVRPAMWVRNCDNENLKSLTIVSDYEDDIELDTDEIKTEDENKDEDTDDTSESSSKDKSTTSDKDKSSTSDKDNSSSSNKDKSSSADSGSSDTDKKNTDTDSSNKNTDASTNNQNTDSSAGKDTNSTDDNSAADSSHPELNAYRDYILSDQWTGSSGSGSVYKKMAVIDFYNDGVYEVALKYAGNSGDYKSGILSYNNGSATFQVLGGSDSPAEEVTYVNESGGRFMSERMTGKAIQQFWDFSKSGTCTKGQGYFLPYLTDPSSEAYSEDSVNSYNQEIQGMAALNWVDVNESNADTYLSGYGKKTGVNSGDKPASIG